MELFKLLGTIAIDASGVDSAVTAVKGKIETLGEKIQTVGDKMSGIGTKLTLGVTMPIVGLGTAAVKTAAGFESSMSEVAAISGATGEDLNRLKNLAEQMGKTTKFSASEAAEGLKYMAMAGWKTEDMLNGLEGIMNLAAASGEDLGATSDIVTDALTAFGLSASDSGHFADILATASSNANTNVSMMGETFKYVAPVAGALGYSAEDTAAAIGLMANAGIKSSQAGTSLRSILSNLQGEVTFCGAGFGEMTVQTTKADGSMRSLGDILEDCRAAFAKMSESERAANAEAVVGREAMSGFLALMTAAPKDIDKLNEAISKCDGSAKSMADTMNDNLSGQITLLKSQLEALAIQFVTLIMPYLRQGVEWLSKLCTWISGLDDNTKKMIITIAGIAAAVGPVLVIGGKIISGAGKIVSGISGVIGIIGKLLPALASIPAPVWIVIAVLGALVAAGVAIYKNWDEIKEWGQKTWSSIKEVVGNAIDAIRGFFQGIIDFAANNWQGLLLLIVNPFIGGFKLLYDNCEAFRNFINGFLDGLKEGFQNFKDNVVEKFAELRDSASEKIHELKEKVTTKFSELKEIVVVKASELKDSAVEKFHDLKDRAEEKFNGMKEAVVSRVEEMKENASAKIYEMGVKVSEGFQEMKDKAAERFSDLKEKWTSKFTETREKMVSEAEEMKEKVGEKLEQFKTSAVEKIESIKTNTVQKFHELKDAAAAKISELSQKGIEGFNSINEKGTAAIENLRNAASAKFTEMGNSIHEKFSSVADKITGIFTKCRDTVHDIVENVKGFFDFEWKLPDIKLPHFSIDGQFSLSPPSIPHLGVEWYAKAMDNPMVMTKPTAFGISPAGQIMAGGEAGSEVVSGTNTLMRMISAAVAENNNRVYEVMERMYALLAEYLPELSSRQLCLDTGALVGELAQPLNDELGWIAHTRGRRS